MKLTLANLPAELNTALVDEYVDLKRRYQIEDWGPAQLMGGRFAEVVIRIYQHLLTSSYTAIGTDISGSEKTKVMNSVQSHAAIDEHVRQKTVPLVRLLLDFRNNRDSAHLGGFDANCMDALFVLSSATWIISELIRVYGGYSMDEAQKIVEDLSVKEYPVIFEIDGELFITRSDLKAWQEALVILYKTKKSKFDVIFSATKDKNKSRFMSTLDQMIAEKLLAKKDENYYLLPLGIRKVEEDKLLSFV